jgi:hypothetical protein
MYSEVLNVKGYMEKTLTRTYKLQLIIELRCIIVIQSICSYLRVFARAP